MPFSHRYVMKPVEKQEASPSVRNSKTQLRGSGPRLENISRTLLTRKGLETSPADTQRIKRVGQVNVEGLSRPRHLRLRGQRDPLKTEKGGDREV